MSTIAPVSRAPIPTPTTAPIDAAIDSALDRIRTRARDFGGGFPALGEAITRAGDGGKRFRPELVIRSFCAFAESAEPPPGLYSVAAAFEILHTAFIVHDDVIDGDTMRRGIPNVSGEFRTRARTSGASPSRAGRLGDAAAILAGDLLLHEAVRLVALADVPPATREGLLALVDHAILVSAAGELADVEHAVAADIADVTELLTTAHDKTAVYSFTAPMQAGALVAGAHADSLAVLADAGRALGLAFQLADDLIGAFGSAAQAGREVGADLREAKRTPLLALARETDSWLDVQNALDRAHTGPAAVRSAQRALDASGARVRVRGLIDAALADARAAALEPALPPAAAELIDELADRVEGRIP